MLCFNKTIDQLVMASSVCWYAHVLKREDGHVLRTALYFAVDGQRKNGCSKKERNNQVEEECMKVGLIMEDEHC